MAGMKGRSGGARPGAGRPKGSGKPRPLLTTADLTAVVQRELAAQAPPSAAIAIGQDPALQRHLAMIGKTLQDLARQTEREPLLRRLTAIERAVGVLEPPKAPRVTRSRPLGE